MVCVFIMTLSSNMKGILTVLFSIFLILNPVMINAQYRVATTACNYPIAYSPSSTSITTTSNSIIENNQDQERYNYVYEWGNHVFGIDSIDYFEQHIPKEQLNYDLVLSCNDQFDVDRYEQLNNPWVSTPLSKIVKNAFDASNAMSNIMEVVFSTFLGQILLCLAAIVITLTHVIMYSHTSWAKKHGEEPQFDANYSKGIWEALPWTFYILITSDINHIGKIRKDTRTYWITLIMILISILMKAILAGFLFGSIFRMFAQNDVTNIIHKNEIVGVVNGSYAQEYMITHHPSVKLNMYSSFQDCTNDLQLGHIDSVVHDAVSNAYFTYTLDPINDHSWKMGRLPFVNTDEIEQTIHGYRVYAHESLNIDVLNSQVKHALSSAETYKIKMDWLNWSSVHIDETAIEFTINATILGWLIGIVLVLALSMLCYSQCVKLGDEEVRSDIRDSLNRDGCKSFVLPMFRHNKGKNGSEDDGDDSTIEYKDDEAD